ncbi:MAG: type III secretion inner membrane ring lipoprotein SctJ [Pseudomonadota bacterium]
MFSTLRRLTAVAAACLVLAGCKSELFTDMSEREANQVIAALMSEGIPASKSSSRGDGVTVMIDQSRFAEAIEILNARGLPSDKYDSFGDVFEKDGLVSSPMEERARYIYALSQELSRTIAEIDGVLSARIHVVLPETDMLGRDFKPSSASVFIRHLDDAPVANFTSQIRLLVSNSIEGLVYDNVTVVAVPAEAKDVSTGNGPILQDVLGVWVHPNSVSRLWLIVGSIGGVAVLALGLLGLQSLSRHRRGQDDDFDLAS